MCIRVMREGMQPDGWLIHTSSIYFYGDGSPGRMKGGGDDEQAV